MSVPISPGKPSADRGLEKKYGPAGDGSNSGSTPSERPAGKAAPAEAAAAPAEASQDVANAASRAVRQGIGVREAAMMLAVRYAMNMIIDDYLAGKAAVILIDLENIKKEQLYNLQRLQDI